MTANLPTGRQGRPLFAETVEKRSRRALVGRTSRPFAEGEKIPDPAELIQEYIDKIGKFIRDGTCPAERHLRKVKLNWCGKDIEISVRAKIISDELDGESVAQSALGNLRTVQICASQLEKCSDIAAARDYARAGLVAALDFASDFHQWTIIDNEPAIAGHIGLVEGAKQGALQRKQNIRQRNIELAKKYLELQPISKKKASSLKAQIGK